ncbi:hypothetical protein A3A46_01320 [Candidatus Roizmanbacteria bacterium RIFCSPLOWO2_01_FULL_37_13]|uniref:Phage-Barnase-EndoU-ColicinE5/D-RelE like nuclease 3 domain-containing protein n=1 Tax=Candidatus Roizmanbacteria bacterium RIFCSPHIGHO2_02_FULL_38_11 TaxID=1802039 RepID=A0A1F7H1C3_9BACT|nr:MAG: hypothetical protein A3C25_01620 [Candidatus Roizmanbacteria bacterium RIFCSPHIGHO2_02_FULL_38_11]OGK32876.1 MAG: hypothetical protein A3F58_01160 [Candidatus Roizmanbacteria bacterium RIFCSPHIGHO2_12_FULL_37_9b]OGK42509.1 MAG: hypothetical protein A3A46_01320 [Candidatus Roizmanbacteria bacterium RIFCSPLOWO2_01_FULL_37_13]
MKITYHEILFEVVSVLNKKIRATKVYWNDVIIIKHKDLTNLEQEVKKGLNQAELVEISKLDKTVYLYYKKINKKYICVVAKHLNEHGFVITAHIATRLRKGKIIWQKSKKK